PLPLHRTSSTPKYQHQHLHAQRPNRARKRTSYLRAQLWRPEETTSMNEMTSHSEPNRRWPPLRLVRSAKSSTTKGILVPQNNHQPPQDQLPTNRRQRLWASAKRRKQSHPTTRTTSKHPNPRARKPYPSNQNGPRTQRQPPNVSPKFRRRRVARSGRLNPKRTKRMKGTLWTLWSKPKRAMTRALETKGKERSARRLLVQNPRERARALQPRGNLQPRDRLCLSKRKLRIWTPKRILWIFWD
ncbi:hypothetical protein FRC00_001559, partial [Tulasnella sp. 408]